MTNDDTEELFWKKGFSLNAKYIMSEEVDFFTASLKAVNLSCRDSQEY